MTPAFSELFTRHVCSATVRQLAPGDVLGERPWAVDLRADIATFAELVFPIQLLGTESHGDEFANAGRISNSAIST